MNMTKRLRLPVIRPLARLSNACLFWVCLSTATYAIEIETFTEPYLRVAVPAAEMGVLSELHVRQGDLVQQSQVLARLDDRVLRASLLVAEAAKNSVSERSTALEELELRNRQLRGYLELQGKGNASAREVDRAQTLFNQANSRLKSIDEQIAIRELEFERTKAQLNQRSIVCPVDGMVVAIDKEVGEFVSPTDPVVLHVVQLKKLKAVFSVPLMATQRLQANQTITLLVGRQSDEVDGVIEWVSPLVDADSGSVPVVVRIENEQRTLRSGVICRWDLKQRPRELRAAQGGEAADQAVETQLR